jgi:hypothetical protein
MTQIHRFEASLLFGDRLAPITSACGFLEADVERCADEFFEWKQDINAKYGYDVIRRQISGNLEEMLKTLLPLTNVKEIRYLFVPTASQWTAYFSNGHRGTDPSPVSAMAKRLGNRTVYVVARPHTYRRGEGRYIGRQGALILRVYGPDRRVKRRKRIRYIELINDAGKWEFHLGGPPLPFEQPERYNAIRKRDRFTFDMLAAYLHALGLSPFEEDFYLTGSSSKAALIEVMGNLSAKIREFTLEEIRQTF